jgi:hypothetical protein
MPYAEYEVVYDTGGRLKRRLDRLPKNRPADRTQVHLDSLVTAVPFLVHDAMTAARRGEGFAVHRVLEEVRDTLFQLAAARSGAVVHGAKHVQGYLSLTEKSVIEESYLDNSPRSIEQLTALYLALLQEFVPDFYKQQEIKKQADVLGEVS